MVPNLNVSAAIVASSLDSVVVLTIMAGYCAIDKSVVLIGLRDTNTTPGVVMPCRSVTMSSAICSLTFAII